MCSSGTSRVEAKLEIALSQKNFYEGHQLIRSLYFRKKQQKKYDELLKLLFDGANKFVDVDQLPIAADLGILLVETLENVPECDGKLWIQKLGDLIKCIGPDTVERESLLLNSVKWVMGRPDANSLKASIHQMLATILWEEGNFEHAKHHFLLAGTDGDEFAKMLIQLSTKAYSREIDLIISQTVLQQLCVKQTPIEVAAKTFDTYTKYHPKIGKVGAPFNLPLLNFIYFLLKVIETGKLDAYRTLVQLYEPSLQRDPVYEKYLQRIAVIWLNAPAPRAANNGIFGDLINQLFQGLEEGELSDAAEELD